MNKLNFKHLFLLLAAAAFILVSCTKEGETGAQGEPGTNGTNGTDGKDGVDGNAACIQCHTIDYMDAVDVQYDMSGHAAGASVGYAGKRNDCAMCHSYEGFVETQLTGRDTTAADIPIPTRIDCATCHSSHATFDFELDGPDYALRGTNPVDLLMYRAADPPSVVTLDMGGTSNLCTNCHQPRRVGPVDDGTGTFRITSTHWGPHHGPQSTTIEGIGAYELGAGYPTPGSSTHRTEASCTSCHMHKATTAEDAGSHTWHVPIESCTGCHEGATNFDINGVQTDVAEMMEQLKQKFIDNNMWDTESDHIIPGTYPLAHAGAYYNYAWIVDDRSEGVHNPSYIKTLLINSIGAFD